MAIYGLTDTGFVRPTMQVIRAAIEVAWRGYFGASIDTSESSPDGQVINIFAEREALVWEVTEVIAGMIDPDKVGGQPLDSLCLITGTFREPASHSAVVGTLTGTPATVVPAGSQAKTTSTNVVFATNENGTLVALPAWAATTAYLAGIDRVTNSGKAYVCITSGTSAGSGGPTTTAADITDGAAHWRHMGTGTAADDVEMLAIDTGPIVAASGDLNLIDTAVSGWQGVINLLDAAPGANRTSDQGLRLLREAELAASGDSPVPAIKRAISRVTGVSNVTVFYNNTNLTDADGLPPHSVEVMVQGGTDQAIREALFRSVAGGIGYYGTVSGTVVDTEGNSHTIKFSRVDEIEIYIILTVDVDAAEYPADGATQIKTATTTWGDLQPSGRDARASIIGAQSFAVPGVLGVTSCLIDDVPAPATSATVVITSRQRATYDSSRITIVANPVTP